jgi:hypothetical protein
MTGKQMVIFPMEDESLADFLQRQAPKGWTIRKVAGICRYEITTDTGLEATVDYRGNISEGWHVKINDTGIAYEFTTTTPDGRGLWFHDCFNP